MRWLCSGHHLRHDGDRGGGRGQAGRALSSHRGPLEEKKPQRTPVPLAGPLQRGRPCQGQDPHGVWAATGVKQFSNVEPSLLPQMSPLSIDSVRKAKLHCCSRASILLFIRAPGPPFIHSLSLFLSLARSGHHFRSVSSSPPVLCINLSPGS